jgi:hypothetical protein
LTLYWTVSNLWQIGQQYALLKLGHIGPEAMERRLAEQRAKGPSEAAKPSFFTRMQERAEQSRKDQQSGKSGGSGKPSGGSGSSKGPQPKQRRPNTGNQKPGGTSGPTPKKRPGSGGNGGKGDGEAGS